MKKAFWRSRTFWFNIISLGVLAAQGQLGVDLPPNVAGPILAVGNLGLRAISGGGLSVK